MGGDSPALKIYFAGSIRGGRDDADFYLALIDHLKKYGDVLTEHIGDNKVSNLGESDVSDKGIHKRDLEWMFSSDVIVAEVSTPSLGVGYEIGRAVEKGKRILCLYRSQDGKRLSAMIAGCPNITNAEYHSLDEGKQIIDSFFQSKKVRD